MCQSIEKLNLDLALVVPNNIPSHKKLPQNTATVQNRLEMCDIMCQNINKAIVSDIEIKLSGESYTILTLRELRKQYLNDELFLIIGTDSFKSFEKWYLFEEILTLCTLVVLERYTNNENIQQQKYLEEKYNIKIMLIQGEVIEVSSTEARNLEINHLLEPEVLQYIYTNKLYK